MPNSMSDRLRTVAHRLRANPRVSLEPVANANRAFRPREASMLMVTGVCGALVNPRVFSRAALPRLAASAATEGVSALSVGRLMFIY